MTATETPSASDAPHSPAAGTGTASPRAGASSTGADAHGPDTGAGPAGTAAACVDPVSAPAGAASPSAGRLHAPVLAWFAQHARDLPWRRPEAGAWGVMVSEFMLQQTPVNRVLPVYEQWLARWPRPAALAAEPSGEAVRAWGRLGYPAGRCGCTARPWR